MRTLDGSSLPDENGVRNASPNKQSEQPVKGGVRLVEKGHCEHQTLLLSAKTLRGNGQKCPRVKIRVTLSLDA